MGRQEEIDGIQTKDGGVGQRREPRTHASGAGGSGGGNATPDGADPRNPRNGIATGRRQSEDGGFGGNGRPRIPRGNVHRGITRKTGAAQGRREKRGREETRQHCGREARKGEIFTIGAGENSSSSSDADQSQREKTGGKARETATGETQMRRRRRFDAERTIGGEAQRENESEGGIGY